MHYDLIIVGGGLVGASLAVALRHSHLKIALIEARIPNKTDPRLIALNWSSCQFLKNIELWPVLSAHAASIEQVHVSHQGRFGTARLHCRDISLPSLGHVIPAHIIESALHAVVTSLPHVTLFCPAKLKMLHQQDQTASLTIETEQGEKMLHAPLVAGADGAESTVRSLLNLPTEKTYYEQSAIVTRTKLHRSHQHIAYERFNEFGAIAMLPLIGNECATIWTADNDFASQLMTLSDVDFLYALQKAFGYRLGRLKMINKRYHFPLQRIVAQDNKKGCVFLLGNSAHTMHPIAAQGFNLALYEAAVFAEGLMENIFDLDLLVARIKNQQAVSLTISHQLANLFSSKSTLMNCMLQMGMVGFNIITPAKKKFITRMIGRSGRVPRLLLSTNE